MKEASGDISLIAHIRNCCEDDFNIWSGNDDQIVPMMSLGAAGVISAAANLIPEIMVQIAHLCLAGKFQSAARVQIDCDELITALYTEVNPIPVKAAMALMGWDSGELRLPLSKISQHGLDVVRRAMKNKGLLTE